MNSTSIYYLWRKSAIFIMPNALTLRSSDKHKQNQPFNNVF